MKTTDADTLIDQTHNLIGRLLRAGKDDIADLRFEAWDLSRRMSDQQKAFVKEHGIDVANPINRAAYLLDITMQHATLLRKPGT